MEPNPNLARRKPQAPATTATPQHEAPWRLITEGAKDNITAMWASAFSGTTAAMAARLAQIITEDGGQLAVVAPNREQLPAESAAKIPTAFGI